VSGVAAAEVQSQRENATPWAINHRTGSGLLPLRPWLSTGLRRRGLPAPRTPDDVQTGTFKGRFFNIQEPAVPKKYCVTFVYRRGWRRVSTRHVQKIPRTRPVCNTGRNSWRRVVPTVLAQIVLKDESNVRRGYAQ
jgi:hypothetical protein